MAIKYWYKAAGGSDNWSVTANWYLSSGGVGATTTVPTSSDDVILNSASGTGTLTVAAGATCRSIDMSGFAGTFAGTSSLTVVGSNNGLTSGTSIYLSDTGTFTYSGTLTVSATGGHILCRNKQFNGNVSLIGATNSAAVFSFDDTFKTSATSTLTLGTGTIQTNGTAGVQIGLFVSNTGTRSVVGGTGEIWYVNGTGTVWNTGATLGNTGGFVVIVTDASNSAKTITNNGTGANALHKLQLSQTGAGSYTVTGGFNYVYATVIPATGSSASISFGNSTIGYLNFYEDWTTNTVGSKIDWNNAANTVTLTGVDSGGVSLRMADNMTVTASPTIVVSNIGSSLQQWDFNTTPLKTLTRGVTINATGASAGFNGVYFTSGDFATQGTLTVTNGAFDGTNLNNAYIGTLSSSNSNTRSITLGIASNLVLTGTGTLISAGTTSGLTFSVDSIVVNESTSAAKTINLNSVVYPTSTLEIGGTGSGTITFTNGSNTNANAVNVTNTGGASFTMTTTTLAGNLNFGTSNVNWNNTALQTITIPGTGGSNSVTLSPNMTISAAPAVVINGYSVWNFNNETWPGTTTFTINDASAIFVSNDTPSFTGTVTLTNGSFSYNSNETYIGNLTFTNNSNSRTFQASNLYLTGTGTLINTTAGGTANAYYDVVNTHVINSGTATKSLTYPSFATNYQSIYLSGNGSGNINLSPTTAPVPNVYIGNTGGANISISTGVVLDLSWLTGTNAIWNNSASQTVTVWGNFSISSSLMSITNSSLLTFNPGLDANRTITTGGKTLTSTVTINDTNGGGGSGVTLLDDFNSTAGITLTLGYFNANNKNLNIGSFLSNNTSNTRTLTMGSGTWTLTTPSANTWSAATNAQGLTLNPDTSIIKITATGSTAATFSGGGQTYYTLLWDRGASTVNNVIGGNNTFINLIDVGTAAHALIFGTNTTNTIGNFVVRGSSGNAITLNSGNNSSTFTLTKSPLGLVSCDWLNIQHSTATPSTGTWYAGPNSVNNQAVVTAGSGWIFTDPPPRKLGAGGVG